MKLSSVGSTNSQSVWIQQMPVSSWSKVKELWLNFLSYGREFLSVFFAPAAVEKKFSWEARLLDKAEKLDAVVFRWIRSNHSALHPCIRKKFQENKSLQATYLALGLEKWRELIDGVHHKHGKMVYDKGLHGSTVEPGYLQSMLNAADFVKQTLGEPITPSWYLQLHKIACAHFQGAKTNTLMGQEKVGIFRGNTDHLAWSGLKGSYQMTLEAQREFYRLGLGSIVEDSSGGKKILYRVMSQSEVKSLLEKYVKDFEKEITASAGPNEKLLAIARFTQRHDWLHPVRDGTGRLEQLILGKLLVENGFHPTILEYPYRSGCRGVVEWKNYIKEGLLAWERFHSRLP